VQERGFEGLTVAALLGEPGLRAVPGHLTPAPSSPGGRVEVFVGGHVARLELVGGGVPGGGVDGRSPPPQGVEPCHEGGVVLEAAPAKKMEKISSNFCTLLGL